MCNTYSVRHGHSSVKFSLPISLKVDDESVFSLFPLPVFSVDIPFAIFFVQAGLLSVKIVTQFSIILSVIFLFIYFFCH